MTIPNGATHVDRDGDYFRFNASEGAYEVLGANHRWLTQADGYDTLDADSATRLGIKPINQAYPGQHEPWRFGWWVIPEMPYGGVNAEVVANEAIKKMMECA